VPSRPLVTDDSAPGGGRRAREGRHTMTATTCEGCVCRSAVGAVAGSRLLVASNVAHTLAGVKRLARSAGLTVRDSRPGYVEVEGRAVPDLIDALALELTSVELAEARALVLCGDEETGTAPGDSHDRATELVGRALRAPTLAQLGARAAYGDVGRLLADEAAHFYSVYQPIVRLSDGGVAGHEALLRASGPEGPVMPEAMFTAAARAGWMHVLDRVGRTTALHGAAGWLGDDWLFVNFVPTTIYRPEVCLRTTERAALDAELRLDQIVFEITESEEVRDVDHLARLFDYYRSRGCRVALDDLGSGFSSLNMMIRLEPDVVKIDRETVQQLPGRTASAVVTAIVDIARAAGTIVLAEGVETAEQADAARELGVELAQGWHFGRPVTRTARAAELAAARPAFDAAPSGAARQWSLEVDPAVAVAASR